MAWSSDDLTRLDAAIASGLRSVTYADGRKKEYQSLSEMMAARRVMAAEIKMQTSAKARRITPYYRSGL
ncbi:MAG: hypothetical protein E2598_07540 [Sphingobium sp.]|nr:hypothetical protein [Sphingobium sp.]